jgi:purine-binding chemotaxis protein CheW
MSVDLTKVLKKQKEQLNSLANDSDKIEEDILQLVGFYVGEEEYAVPILSIQEIIKPIDFTRVPKTPGYVLGVFNLRGNVIPLIDLRRKFNLPPQKESENTRYIVMKDNNNNIAGFVIDKLTEAIRLKESQIEQAPETLKKDKGMIYGIGKRENSIITILQVDKLLQRDF